jgi:hypothetical protein
VYRSGIGIVSLWLDSNRNVLALQPNEFHMVPNWLQEKLGDYGMADPEVFESGGACIAKIEAGSVYFAHAGGQPVMIACDERPGWFASVAPGFSFAREIVVDDRRISGCRAKLSSAYISFEVSACVSRSMVPEDATDGCSRLRACGVWLRVARVCTCSTCSPTLHMWSPTTCQDWEIVSKFCLPVLIPSRLRLCAARR